ncbi:MAG: hypothetical protein E8A46_06430 [Bradyrhizobium sp.]|nr:MAG: hypothetical protein E8A46_06430 [Bradyrhizobium sp.]
MIRWRSQRPQNPRRKRSRPRPDRGSAGRPRPAPTRISRGPRHIASSPSAILPRPAARRSPHWRVPC